MKIKVLIILSVILLLLTFMLYFTHLPGSEPLGKKKGLVAAKLKEKGISGGYIVISEKRHKWYNSILPNAVDQSFHLKGMAVDFWVMDLNKDGRWDEKDIDLMLSIIFEAEKENPGLTGGTGTYLNSGFLASRMVHTDVSGVQKIWQH
ncbi:MAG TPA: hypothetical protein PLW31_03125 [Bacteroidales bacterium]|nr:hypothetical protein [Bacteroidales bacterium]